MPNQRRVGRPEDPNATGIVIDAGEGAVDINAPLGVNINGAALSGAYGAFGFPYTVDPGMVRATGTDVLALAANAATYGRCLHGGTISKIGLEVGTASGNISVAVYRNVGSGRLGVPATQLATSGAVACPAAGYREIALGATVDLLAGDWLALSSDNATATFKSLLAATGDSNIGLGRQFRQATAHPLPATPASLVATLGWTIVLLGVT